MDFTLILYKHLLSSLIKEDYSFQTFEQYLQKPLEKVIILRHDVDLLAHNSLTTAQIENVLGITGTYYFRIVKESNKPEIIKKIADLGHEIGYHYETMDSRSSEFRVQSSEFKERLIDAAYIDFCKNLEYFRTFYPVKTICMHGSPLSKYDNRDIWKKYDYKSLGLIGEPYFDIDFSKVLYLTDTGRRWDGDKVSVRDKVSTRTQNSEPKTQNSQLRTQSPERTSANSQLSTLSYSFRHTKDIIKSIENEYFPNQAMITVHPQRWNNSMVLWAKELIMQNVKNVIKRGLIIIRKQYK